MTALGRIEGGIGADASDGRPYRAHLLPGACRWDQARPPARGAGQSRADARHREREVHRPPSYPPARRHDARSAPEARANDEAERQRAHPRFARSRSECSASAALVARAWGPIQCDSPCLLARCLPSDLATDPYLGPFPRNRGRASVRPTARRETVIHERGVRCGKLWPQSPDGGGPATKRLLASRGSPLTKPRIL